MPDERTYIKVHDGLPDHPKIEGLSDKAFRLLIETWCWSSRHLADGRMPLYMWRKRGSVKARRELEDGGLIEHDADEIVMHDYLEHQRSAAGVEERRQARKRSARVANHVRHHVEKRTVNPKCEFCADDHPPGVRSDSDPPPDDHPPGLRSDLRSDSDRTPIGLRIGPPIGSEADLRSDSESDPKRTSGFVHRGRGR